MATQQQSFYEILGVKNDAKVTDIGRAYNKAKAQMRQETAAPDKRREVLVEKAYETLSDPARREAYDRSLLAPVRKRHTAMIGSIAVAIAVIVAGGYFALLPPPPAQGKPPPAAADVLQSASFAIGALKRIDMSGQTTSVGEAFAIREGVMVTTCREIVPGAQLMVHLSPRDVPARVSFADEVRGLCQLAVEGAGSKPLVLSGAVPRPGDRIYSTRINAVGEVMLIEGSVKKVSDGPAGRVVEASMPVATNGAGGPLLDAYGRVLGAAMLLQPDDRGRFVSVPVVWAEERRPDPAPPPRASVVEEKPAPTGAERIPPERRERLEKAFRPPPTVPGDL